MHAKYVCVCAFWPVLLFTFLNPLLINTRYVKAHIFARMYVFIGWNSFTSLFLCNSTKLESSSRAINHSSPLSAPFVLSTHSNLFINTSQTTLGIYLCRNYYVGNYDIMTTMMMIIVYCFIARINKEIKYPKNPTLIYL